MNQLEESKVSALKGIDDPEDRRSAQKEIDSPKHDSRIPRISVIALILFQCVFLIVIGWIALSIRSKLDVTRALQHNQAIATREISDTTRTLQAEISHVRQFLSSTSAENVIFLKMMTLTPDLEPKLAAQIARAVHRYGALYGQDPNLILSIMFIESKFNPDAVSPKGATGLMQIMPQWKKVLGISEDLRDPETSIKYGLQILGFYQEMYRETEMALIAYNRGPGPVDMALMKGKNPNNGYPDKVLATYDRLKAMNVGSL